VIGAVARVLIQDHHCIDGLSSRVTFDFHIIVLLFQRLQSDFLLCGIYIHTLLLIHTHFTGDTFTTILIIHTRSMSVRKCPRYEKKE